MHNVSYYNIREWQETLQFVNCDAEEINSFRHSNSHLSPYFLEQQRKLEQRINAGI